MNRAETCGSVLVVEDNEVLLETLKFALEMKGYHVITAMNGKEALDAIDAVNHPCLILLDMFMPVMDGWEFLNQLKMKEGDLVATLPIVICSAAGARAEEAAKQVRGFIKKPVDLDVLFGIVEKHCGPPSKVKSNPAG